MMNIDNSVSRAHAKLKVIGAGAYVILEHCGSSNDTLLGYGEALLPAITITITQEKIPTSPNWSFSSSLTELIVNEYFLQRFH
jgi:hypothetical protein